MTFVGCPLLIYGLRKERHRFLVPFLAFQVISVVGGKDISVSLRTQLIVASSLRLHSPNCDHLDHRSWSCNSVEIIATIVMAWTFHPLLFDTDDASIKIHDFELIEKNAAVGLLFGGIIGEILVSRVCIQSSPFSWYWAQLATFSARSGSYSSFGTLGVSSRLKKQPVCLDRK